MTRWLKLGVGSYTLPWAIGVAGQAPQRPLSALKLLEWAVHHGAEAVQYCDNLPLTQLEPAELDLLERLAHSTGLQIQVGTRGLEPQNLLVHLALAKRYASPPSTPFVRLVIDSLGDEPTPEQAVARLKPLEPHFRNAGVKLALENHDRFPARVLRDMLEALGNEWTAVCLDTVNSLGCGEDIHTLLEHLGPRTLNLHVKDYSVRRIPSQMGFGVSGAPAGQGLLDLPSLLTQLPHCESVTLELWTPLEHSLEQTLEQERRWAGESLEYLRSLPPFENSRSSQTILNAEHNPKRSSL
jgi:3-oxoisoapionate decarboxylase